MKDELNANTMVDGDKARSKIMAFLMSLVHVFDKNGKTLAYFPMEDGSEWVWSKKPIVQKAMDKKAGDILKS